MLWVSVCSINPKIYFDRTCILLPGDHSFIKQDSYVAYNFLSQIQQPHLDRMVQLRDYHPKEDCRPDVLQRILDGVERTEEAPRGLVAEYARARALQDPSN